MRLLMQVVCFVFGLSLVAGCQSRKETSVAKELDPLPEYANNKVDLGKLQILKGRFTVDYKGTLLDYGFEIDVSKVDIEQYAIRDENGKYLGLKQYSIGGGEVAITTTLNDPKGTNASADKQPLKAIVSTLYGSSTEDDILVIETRPDATKMELRLVNKRFVSGGKNIQASDSKSAVVYFGRPVTNVAITEVGLKP